MNQPDLQHFAARYAAAWCSQRAASVASFFAPDGSLQINAAPPSVGCAAITADAQSFMTAFPDLHVSLDSLAAAGERTVFHWTLTGTHAATGRFVRISGNEAWLLSAEGLIQHSLGYFDEADYQRQLHP